MQDPITILKTSGPQEVFFAVDTADVPKISKYDWCLSNNDAIEADIPKTFWLANYIMDAMNGEDTPREKKLYVEFIDGNYYNLTRKNLKVHTFDSYVATHENKYVIVPNTLAWDAYLTHQKYKTVRYRYREGFIRDIPAYMWAPSHADALEKMISTAIWVEYKGEAKEKYDEFNKIMKKGVSVRK